MFKASTFEEIEKYIHKGLVKVPYCSLVSGTECYKKIKEHYKAEVRGEVVGEKRPTDKYCVVCDAKANHYAYLARQY